jgi:hypothetical protein
MREMVEQVVAEMLQLGSQHKTDVGLKRFRLRWLTLA